MGSDQYVSKSRVPQLVIGEFRRGGALLFEQEKRMTESRCVHAKVDVEGEIELCGVYSFREKGVGCSAGRR